VSGETYSSSHSQGFFWQSGHSSAGVSSSGPGPTGLSSSHAVKEIIVAAKIAAKAKNFFMIFFVLKMVNKNVKMVNNVFNGLDFY
jgi:hypothetical protein